MSVVDALAAPAPPADATSARILDAALALAAESGLRNLTMDDVARRAGVGRMTVYRRFGDRGRLVEALTAREAIAFLARMDAASRPEDPIADQVAAGFATAIRLAREHPLLNRLARIEPDSVVRSLRDDGSALFGMCRAYLAERLRQAQRAGVLAADAEVEAAAEILVRLAVSFVLVEDTVLPLEDDEAARAVARRLVAPILAS
jgi:TetR/AcrR family transcriptional repressor of uid operon